LIGDWINGKINERMGSVKKSGPEDANMELLKLTDNVTIQSTDSEGKMSWETVTHVTRHDPSELIYEVITRLGRKVNVVASKSLLVWDPLVRNYIPKDTKDVTIGDELPVAINYKQNMIVKSIKISDYI
jgi:hypothetical protein